MTESDKKAPLDDFDWDAALAEWDKQPFSPEVAGEKKEPKPGAVAADAKPLYRPPMKTMDPAASQVSLPASPPRPPPPATKPQPPPPPVPPRKRGGLGHLFSRPDARKAPGEEEQAIDVFLEEPVARKRFRAEDDEEGVVTKTPSTSRPGGGDIEEALAAAAEAPLPEVPDGAMFDPFADPEPRGKKLPSRPPASDDGRGGAAASASANVTRAR